MKTNIQRGGRRLAYVLLAIIVAVYGYAVLFRPVTNLKPLVSSPLSDAALTSNLNWPASGQASVSIAGTSILENHGSQTPVPIASTAKIITVLNVLQAKPLQLGQTGPTITLTANDVAIYNAYAAQHGSVVPVQAGEKITEYQMLQAIMLPSANNMADSLAIWAFGSLDKYAVAANQYLVQHNLSDTHVGSDASGLAPSTTSTAYDLVKLGGLAMQNPVLAQVVGQATVSGIPLAPALSNVNILLGNSGIIGVKTGNTDEAGGVFVGAARTTVNGKSVTVLTSVAGAPNLFTAMKTSLLLIRSAEANFSTRTVVKAGTVVGMYVRPEGGSAQAITAKDLAVKVWRGTSVSTSTTLQPLQTPAKAGQNTGQVVLSESALNDRISVPVILKQAAASPSIWWRLLHPL